MRRREFTALTAGALFTATAGCMGDGESTPEGQGNDEPDATSDSGDDTAETETESDTETEEPEEDANSEDRLDPGRYEVYVSDVINGHRIEVEFDDATTETVRLAGVQAPAEDASEVNPDDFYDAEYFENYSDKDGSNEESQREFLADIGLDASGYLKRNIRREEVELEIDPETPYTDENGDLVGTVIWDAPRGPGGSTMVRPTFELAGRGYVRATDMPSEHHDELHEIQDSAMNEAEGMWGY